MNSHLSWCSSGFRNAPLACARNSARCSSMLTIALDAYGATCSLYLAHSRISAFFVRVYLRCGHLRCLENLSCNSLWTVSTSSAMHSRRRILYRCARCVALVGAVLVVSLSVVHRLYFASVLATTPCKGIAPSPFDCSSLYHKGL
jgi:hypothetical protein